MPRGLVVSRVDQDVWDTRGALPHADEPSRAAAFLCAEGLCSAPALTAEDLRARAERRRFASKTEEHFGPNEP